MHRSAITFSVGLIMATLIGCTAPSGTAPLVADPSPAPSASVSTGQFALAWKHDLSARAQGVAVVPTGEVYLGVNASLNGSDPFAEGGGAMVFASSGAKLKDIPTILEPAYEGATRRSFYPRAPRVASSSVLLSNYSWDIFRIDATSRTATQLKVDLDGITTGVTGIDADGAFSADGSTAYLTGAKVYVLDLVTGKLKPSVDFGSYVRQVVPASASAYLVNLTENFDAQGHLALWNPTTGAKSTFEVPNPVHAIAVQDTWAVGVTETGLTEYQVVEWDLATTPPAEKNLGSFRMTGGNELRMAIRPGKRQVAIGTAGISAVSGGSITLLTGSTVFIDADKGTIGRADTSSVQGLSFSPDGGMLYVADTGGLKAFVLP